MRRLSIRTEALRPRHERGLPIVQALGPRRRPRASLLTVAARAVSRFLALYGIRP